MPCGRSIERAIAKLSNEDLRVLGSQSVGVKHLLPRLITVLEREAFAEGDAHPGDVLTALVRPQNWPALEGEAKQESIGGDAVAGNWLTAIGEFTIGKIGDFRHGVRQFGFRWSWAGRSGEKRRC